MNVDDSPRSRRSAGKPPATRLVIALSRDFATLRHIRDRAVEFVRRHRPGADADAVADLRIVLDELAGNAMRHARPPCELTVSLRDGRVLVEVADSSADLARPRDVYGGGGRGLALIGAIARRWGQIPRAGGKVVWAELDLSASGVTRRTGDPRV